MIPVQGTAPAWDQAGPGPGLAGGRGRLARIGREPFVQFFAIGALLFLLFGLAGRDPRPDTMRIDLRAEDVEQLAVLFTAQWGRPPTEAELDGLVDERIREEVLYREAQALGMDRDDPIVRRRLAQKMEFLIGGREAVPEPDDAALAAYLSLNAERYRLPARLSFQQVYIDAARRGVHAEGRAARVLDRLRAAERDDLPVAAEGDPSPFAIDHAGRTRQEIAGEFGEGFAETLGGLPIGVWVGPVASAYGVHLVRVNARSESRMPELAEVRREVLRDYMHQARRTADALMLRELRGRYTVVVAGRPASPPVRGPER